MRNAGCGLKKKINSTIYNLIWELLLFQDNARKGKKEKGWTFFFSFCILEIYAVKKDGRLAQLVRAPVSHTGGRGFNSLTAYQ